MAVFVNTGGVWTECPDKAATSASGYGKTDGQLNATATGAGCRFSSCATQCAKSCSGVDYKVCDGCGGMCTNSCLGNCSSTANSRYGGGNGDISDTSSSESDYTVDT